MFSFVKPVGKHEGIMYLNTASSTHCILVDSSAVICWMSPFVFLGVSGLF